MLAQRVITLIITNTAQIINSQSKTNMKGWQKIMSKYYEYFYGNKVSDYGIENGRVD